MTRTCVLPCEMSLSAFRSVLIVTIDEKEYLHLGCLFEEIFPEARIQMVSTNINPASVARDNQFGRTDEYLFFICFGDAGPAKLALSADWLGIGLRVSRLFCGWCLCHGVFHIQYSNAFLRMFIR